MKPRGVWFNPPLNFWRSRMKVKEREGGRAKGFFFFLIT